MRDAGGAQPGGRRSDRQLGLHCVGGRSQVLPTDAPSSLPCPPFLPLFAIGCGVRAHCSVASTLTNQFSAQYHSVSRVFIIISCRPQAGRRGRDVCAVVSRSDVGILFVRRPLSYNFCSMCDEVMRNLHDFFLTCVTHTSNLSILLQTSIFHIL